MRKNQNILVILFLMMFLPMVAFGVGTVYLVDDNGRVYYSEDNVTVYYIDIDDNNMTYNTDDNGTTLYYKDEDNNNTYYTDYNMTILYYKDEEGNEYYKDEQKSIEVLKGRSVISGNIDVSKLPNTIYAIWYVDGGNWYGYSPDNSVKEAITKKYRVMKDNYIIPAYKAVIVWANEDSSIELESDLTIKDVTQAYGKNFTIHGSNNISFSADDIVCSDTNNSVTGVFKVSGDESSVYLPSREVNTTTNFSYLYQDEGYYVLCEQKLGGSSE
ncbi:MAG: hypothetical protein QM493_10600 [Sulfurovum sp.]